MIRSVVLAVVAACVFVGCGDDVQFAKAPAKVDQKSTPAPAVASEPEKIPTHGTPDDKPAGAPPADPFADGGTPKIEKNASKADPEEVVVGGTIEVDPSVQLPTKTLFVYLIGSPTERIPLLARRYDDPKFPLTFEIRRKDTAMGAAVVDKPVWVRAMLSDSGDVMRGRSKTVSDKAFEPYKTRDARLLLK